jgi:hypothetical protein
LKKTRHPAAAQRQSQPLSAIKGQPRCFASAEVLTHHPQTGTVERQNVIMREHQYNHQLIEFTFTPEKRSLSGESGF